MRDDLKNETGKCLNVAVYSPSEGRTYPHQVEYSSRSIDNSQPTENSLLLRQNMQDKLRKYRQIIQRRNLLVDVFAIFFGIGTWVGINGTFLQLPVLVDSAPEHWSLPSYLSVMVQIGNIGPLLYTGLQKVSADKINESHAIYILLGMGTISSILTAFFYDHTASVAGAEHSVALFVLTFFTSVTACTSSVLFMPYMGRFKEIYLITYLFGEGLSGLLPSVVALIQGVGGAAECVLNQTESGSVYEKYQKPPRFGSMEFFLFVFSMMLCSCIGFLLLDKLRLSKREYAAVTVLKGNKYVYENKNSDSNDMDITPVEVLTIIPPFQYKSLLFLITVVSFFANGMFNSIQSYSTMPYGNQAYHLTATLSAIANPVACFIAVFLPHTSLWSILILTGIGSLITVYVFATAIMSPYPPLVDYTFGGIIIIVLWVLLIGIVSYVKLCITSVMRAQGGKSLVLTGGLTQLGSALGSIFIFVLINYTTSFVAYEDKCG